MNSGVRIRIGYQHSQFWPILVCIMDYYPPYWDPRAISMTDDPRGAFTCSSLTLIVLANSDPFCGLLLTILGSQKQFPRLTIPVVRLRVCRQHSQFWPILTRFVDYYSPFWGPRAISTIHDPGGAFTCPSSTLIVLANSDPFRGLLLIVLGSRNDFHSC